MSKIFDSDGGEDVRQWLGESGEVRCFHNNLTLVLANAPIQPILPQVFTSHHPAMTIHESWQVRLLPDWLVPPPDIPS